MHKVTLSFDNGPDPEVTPMVLDLLRKRGIKSSFFVIGDKLRDRERYKLCVRAHEEGHWIGNHTFNHLTPLGLIQAKGLAVAEIARTQGLLAELAHPDKLFRPFGGGGMLDRTLLSRPALDYLVSENFTCVLWNVVPRDWEDPDGWAATAVQQCRKTLWPLVVLHDLATGAMAHLERFIDEIQRSGARFEQDFPPECVPIRGGKIVLPINQYLAIGG